MISPACSAGRIVAFALVCVGLSNRAAAQEPFPSFVLDSLRFRQIGPAVTGGRIHDVEALPNDPSTIYVATASGGIWKSTNKGTTWQSIFDGQAVSTFGDLAIAPSDPNVIYAGTGEQQNRQSTSWGNGVYRSDDAGVTWRHVGLSNTLHIGRVRVHPTRPDVAYVAALGNLWGPSVERGVFKTTNGGRTWSKVLYVDTLTGAVDLVIDPADPDVLYAATYQRLRRTWGFNGGGPGSGIYKTTNGGRTWRELTNGIPRGDKGRIGLAIAESNPRVLNAIIEHTSQGGIYRTENAGASWERVNALDQRPMYYSHIYLDPTDPARFYALATNAYASADGGRTIATLPYRPTYDVGVHSDFHAMWIDPNDPEHFYLAGDGGLHETWDRGNTFIRINNFPIGQFYAIGVDMRDPYWIYGGMQDNHSWMGPSATRHWIGIINDDWRQIGFGDGMYWQADRTDYRYVYGNAQNGDYTRLDPETGDVLDIRPYPAAGEEPYRWDWVSPLLVSQHDPKVVYLGGNRLFLSRDRGVSWWRTADLTRRIDRDTLELMGVRGVDITLSRNDGTESYGEIVTIAESPLDPAVLWVGTDDGNVQVSRDGGRTWTKVSGNVRGVPDGTYVSRIAASERGSGVAYATFDAHRDGDFAPYVYRTDDFGRSWTSLTSDLPRGSVNVIVEHPDNPNLLFLGTEHALYASGDGGVHWTRFAQLPTTLYDDLLIHPREGDLVVATHGRSLYILDDGAPLAEWSTAVARSPAHLFSVRRATIKQYWKDTSYRGQAAYAGENPPDGAILTYYLGTPADSAIVTVADASGAVVRRYAVSGSRGLHRIVWDLRHEPPAAGSRFGGGYPENALPALPHPVGPRGPQVSPGIFTVALDANGRHLSQTVEVRGDPLLPLTQADYEAREAFLVGLSDMRQQIGDLVDRSNALSRADEGGARSDELGALRGELQQLRRRVSGLSSALMGSGVQQGSLYPPTETHRQRKVEMEAALGQIRGRLEQMEGQ